MSPSVKEFKTAILFHNGSIGDFLMFIYLAELLQKSGCIDHATIVVPKNLDFLQGFLGAYPYISAVEVSRRGGWSQIVKTLQRPRLVIIQPTVGKIPLRIKVLGSLLSRCSGAEFIGFQDKGRLCKALYSRTLTYDTDRLYSENIQSIVRSLDAPVLVQVPTLAITGDDRSIHAHGLDTRRYIVFHPGASMTKRAFTIQGAQDVIEHVLKRNPEMRVVLSGSRAEGKWIEEIRNGILEQERAINTTGCSAREIATLIQGAEFFIGTDSGITHLACFLGARVIVAAHHGTANWLPFYCPSATVLYRLAEEEAVHQSREYLDARRQGRLKPFGRVPSEAICAAVDKFIGGLERNVVLMRPIPSDANENDLCNAR